MDIKQLFDDDRAVSPVIGVILMVAITVILAAVIGTFVLGLGDQVQSTTPQASFGFDTEDGKSNVTVTHESGDSIAAPALTITSQSTNWDTPDNSTEGTSKTWEQAKDDSDVSAGSSVTMIGTSSFGGDTVRVVYNNPDADSSSTLGKFEVPE